LIFKGGLRRKWSWERKAKKSVWAKRQELKEKRIGENCDHMTRSMRTPALCAPISRLIYHFDVLLV
jgi:hypothetical protein